MTCSPGMAMAPVTRWWCWLARRSRRLRQAARYLQAVVVGTDVTNGFSGVVIVGEQELPCCHILATSRHPKSRSCSSLFIAPNESLIGCSPGTQKPWSYVQATGDSMSKETLTGKEPDHAEALKNPEDRPSTPGTLVETRRPAQACRAE